MEVWLELTPAPWDPKNNWYAGSVSSVRLDGVEMLDAFKDAMKIKDYERRCMLIDRLQISPRGRKAKHDKQPKLTKAPYKLVSTSSGPVRASVTILSQPVRCGLLGSPGQKEYPITCRLQRVISLYKDETYVLEELKIIVVPSKHINEKDIANIPFKLRYFSYIDFGIDFGSDLYLTDETQEWFTVGTTFPPRQGYGFASDMRSGKVKNPHPEYPPQEDKDKTFSWHLLTTTLSAKCLHLFRCGDPREFREEIEKAWNEQIYKPLTAKILERSKASAHKRP
jgi:hypothetical protein